MHEIEINSCVNFRPRTSADKDYVMIGHKESGCFASLGYYGPGAGEHNINLNYTDNQPGCVTKSIVIHEALHILGMIHEQSRPDRNEFITVNWEKIKVEKRFQFNCINKQFFFRFVGLLLTTGQIYTGTVKL